MRLYSDGSSTRRMCRFGVSSCPTSNASMLRYLKQVETIVYRLYYQFLRSAIEPENRYRIYLDLKDTRGHEKIAELRKLLSTDADDARAVETLQHIRSHEVKLAQITDLLLGAVGFARRERQEHENSAKRALSSSLENSIGHSLRADTPPGATKVVLATWHDEDALLL